MTAHLKDKDIDRLVSGMMNRKDTLRAQKHLEECDSCRIKAGVLSGILCEKKNNSIPGDHVQAAVIAEWHRMNSGITTKRVQPALSIKLVYGFAAAVIIAVSAYFALIRMPRSIYEDGLHAASLAGEVHFNNTAAGINYKLHKGDVVSTGTASSVTLTAGSYSLSIESSSGLELAESNSQAGFHFILNRGAVTSRSDGKVKYAFTCSGYHIAPAGTEFRIEMSGRNITVAVWNGRVVVSGADLKIEVPAGMTWNSADPGNIKPADNGNSKDNKTGPTGRSENSGDYNAGDKVKDTDDRINKKNEVNPGEIRDLKKESREEIREMKKENRKGRQFRGGN